MGEEPSDAVERPRGVGQPHVIDANRIRCFHASLLIRQRVCPTIIDQEPRRNKVLELAVRAARKYEVSVDFRILGPLEVLGDGAPVAIGGAKHRALLAALLLHANEVVSTDRLIDDLWDEQPPASAANALQVYVSGLRKALGTALIVTRAPGYVLVVEPEAIDALRFERLAAEGRAALAGEGFEDAAAALHEALALWRGPALADLAYEAFAVPHVARLEELRLGAREDLIEARLGLGASSELVGELEGLIAEQPVRERLRAQLMLALYRAGRQADALDAYRSAARFLREELGMEPSRALQQLEQAILRQEAALELALPPRPKVEQAPARKPVTAVVVALEPTGESLDPEAEHGALAPLAAEVARVFDSFGATVELAPDGTVVGLFGVPAVHEDDALRAARAALGLPDASELRTGVARGLGIVTGTRVAGGVVREARRLSALAPAGEVLVDDATRRLLADAAELERSADGAWLLRGVDAAAAAIVRRLDAPLVGRGDELDTLLSLFGDAVRTPGVRIATVVGSPGIGKSRLVKELTDRCAASAEVLYGHSRSFGEDAAFQPLAEIARRLAGEDVSAGLQALLSDAEGAAVAERIAGTIDAIDRPTPIAETAWAVRRLFERLAERRPLVVVFEDVHWAEPALLEVVEHVARSTAAVPLLVLCVSRPDRGAPFPSEAWLEVSLDPLDEESVDALLDRVLPAAGVDPALRSRIVRTAEGNPLFLEQMAAMLEEPQAASGMTAVPASIQALIGARLDLLPADERGVLDPAAVVGRAFQLADVTALVPGLEREAAVAALASLEAKRLVAGGEVEGYLFHHQLIREVAYDAIPKRTRAGLHLRYTDRLEADPGFSAGELDELAGYHLERAFQLTSEVDPHAESLADIGLRAQAYLRGAGERARAGPAAAVDFLERANALPAPSEKAQADVLLALGIARRQVGDFRAADTAAREAVELAERLGEPALAARARTFALRIRLQVDSQASMDDALLGAAQTIEELEALGDHQGLGQAWWMVAWVESLRCRAAATEDALAKAVASARKAGDETTLVDCQNVAILTWLFGPRPVPEAIALCEEIAGRVDTHAHVRAAAHRALGGLNAMLGRFEDARSQLARDRELIEERGLHAVLGAAAEVGAMVELAADDPAAAEQRLREGMASLERAGESVGLSNLTAMLAEAVYRQDRPDEVLQITDLTAGLALDDDIAIQVERRAPQARVLAARGQADEAEALAREAVELAAPTDFLNLQGGALLALADVLWVTGRAGATEKAEAALALFRQKGNVVAARKVERLIAAAGAGVS